jgi:hypothetical protein
MNAKRQPTLSKTRIQSGRQCHKRLWLELNRPEAVEWGEAAQQRLDEGTRFGVLAQQLLGGGVLIEADHRHAVQALADTQVELSKPYGKILRLFEAAFEHERVRVRVDAFECRKDGDTLIEVKSTTVVKDEHLWDCAIQTWVARGAGRKVKRIVLAHVDNQFVYRSLDDYEGLLVQEDITEQVEALLPKIPGVVAELKEVAAGNEPTITTGPHCSQPYECPCLNYCRAAEPPGPEFPVDILPRAGKLVAELKADGYFDLRKVPDDRIPNARHRLIARTTRSGKPHVAPELAQTLDALTFPRYYLDFETISFVVPRWLGTRPFQQVPFQFSCHVERANGKLDHNGFLDLSGASPLPAFVDALIDALSKRGPILVWNQGFEATRIKELAQMFPERSEALLALNERMIDLLPIYREHYYHRDMRGSWSIKAVLPTIAPDLDYSQLEVGDGGAAQDAFLRAIAESTAADEKQTLHRQLLAYCERDTLAMVRLAQWRPSMERQAREAP